MDSDYSLAWRVSRPFIEVWFFIFAPGFSLKKARSKSENPVRRTALPLMLGLSADTPQPIDFCTLQMASPAEEPLAKTLKLNPAEKVVGLTRTACELSRFGQNF